MWWRAALIAGEQPSCTHQEEEGEELRWSGDRQRALGDELPASPRCNTALHDRANSFQAAGGRRALSLATMRPECMNFLYLGSSVKQGK